MSQSNPDQAIAPITQGPVSAPIYGQQLPDPHGPQPPFGSHFQPTLPVRQSDYVMFWRTPAWRWWRPVVALLLTLFLGVLAATMIYGVSLFIDTAAGRIDPLSAGYDPFDITALGFLANNLGLASLIVIAGLVSSSLFKQRAGFLASVVGKLRWGWLGRCVLMILPLWIIYIGLDTWLSMRAGASLNLAVNPDTWLLAFGILLTTPLQAAGEEFAFRGVTNRAVASFFSNGRAGLVAGAVSSSLVFTAAHAAGDPWLNVYYFCFGLAACYVTWRTGGLEAAIAIHVVNNVCSEAFLPFSGVGEIFHREAGTAGPLVLVGMVVIALAVALIVWQAEKRDIQVTAAPGESMANALAGLQATIPTPQQPPMYPRPPLPQPGPRPQPGPENPPPPPRGVTGDDPAPLLNPRPWESS